MLHAKARALTKPRASVSGRGLINMGGHARARRMGVLRHVIEVRSKPHRHNIYGKPTTTQRKSC